MVYSTHVWKFSVWPIFSPNQITVFWMSISWRQRIYWYMDIFRCMDMFLITKILDLAYVQNYMRCLSQNKSDTKLLRVYLFTVFTIKRPRALASLASLGLLIVKTVTNILYYLNYYILIRQAMHTLYIDIHILFFILTLNI